MDAVNEIKSRLSIEEVVSQYVQLKKAGRNFKGLCPFHEEKTPSFVVSPDKQLAYCFGCNKGGDIFKFIEEVEGVDFREALSILGEQAGVEIVSTQNDKNYSKNKDKKEVLFEINKSASLFFQELLFSDDGEKALEYAKKRGLTEETIKDFSLGYACNDFEKTYNYLLKQGFQKEDIVEAGLAVAKDTEMHKVYDRFRGRFIFPILDLRSRVVGFTGRVIDGKDEAKYLNSADSLIFDKSSLLYGIDKAKESIKKEGKIVLVEGNMDVIASHQAGVKNVVATCGTALNEKQLVLTKRFSKELNICFDSDEAGKAAAKRAIQMAQEQDFSIRLIDLGKWKDPDECLQEGVEVWKKKIGESKNYVDYYLDDFLNKKLKGVKKKEAIEEILQMVKRVKNKIERDDYIKKIASLLQVNASFVYDDLDRIKIYSGSRKEKEKEITRKKDYGLDEYLLGLIYSFPHLLHVSKDNFRDEYFDQEECRLVYRLMLKYTDMHGMVFEEDIFESFPLDIVEKWKRVFFLVGVRMEDENENFISREFNDVMINVKKSFCVKMEKDLILKMREAKEKSEVEKVREIMKKYSQVIKMKSEC